MNRFEKISLCIVIIGFLVLLAGIVTLPFSDIVAGYFVLSALGMAVIGFVIWVIGIFSRECRKELQCGF